MSIFNYNRDTKKTAYMNWRIEKHEDYWNLAVLGSGYLKGATILIEDCLNDNLDNKADIVIFPILHGAIHGIEVYLKSIYNILAVWLEEDKKYIGGHDIMQFYHEVFKIMERFDCNIGEKLNLSNFQKYIATIKIFIEEIYDKTQKMDFVRYPIDTKKEDHFYVVSRDNVVVDLEVLYEELIKIKNILHNISVYYADVYDEYISYRNEDVF